jgi:hypothetical protein
MSETTMVIEPRLHSTRIEVRSTVAPRARLLSAELLAQPSHPRAVQWLIEAVALWQGSPVHAALVARERDATYVTLRISRFRERSDRRDVNTRLASRERRDRRHVNSRIAVM